MIAVAIIGLVPLLTVPLLRREERHLVPRAGARAGAGMSQPRRDPGPRRTWGALWRILERDERVFAVLLAVVMVGGLATLGLFPLRASRRFDVVSLVLWFAVYKVGVFALVTVVPRATRAIFIGALAVDLLLVFVLLYITGRGRQRLLPPVLPAGGGERVLLRAVGRPARGPRRRSPYAAAAALVPPWPGWPAVIIVMALVGLPAFALGHVAERERRARAEVERLNAELTVTLNRLRAAQEELVVAERMATVGRLSLKVAHEVRNPIAAIELNAELVGDIVRERGGADMDEAASLVDAIRDQVNTLDALTEEYLAFARFPRPHFEEDSVNDMVSSLVEFVRPLATRQGIALSVETDPGMPPMAMDRTLLRQAILNLVKNGLEVLAKGGTLAVTTRRVEDTVEISVARQRPGHRPRGGPPALRAVLHHQGAGDGARALHHAPGPRGARRAASAGRASPAPAPPSPRSCPSRGARMPDTARLLVADDDPAVRQSLERALAREGYEVVLAPDGQTALERLREGDIDLVLSDLKMPGLTGLELLRQVRTVAPEVDVIMLTAFGTVEEAVRAMKDGARDFLTKPFQRGQLVRVIRQALEHRALVAQNRALQQRLDDLLRAGNIIGTSPAFRRLMTLIEPGGRQLGHRPHPGRERHRQGAVRRGHPPALVAARRPLRGRELRGPAGDPAGVRAVRLREGRVHGGGRAQGRSLRAGRRRHPVPRRGGRPVAGDAAQDPARAAGGRVRAGGRHPDPPGRRAHRRRHQPGPGASWSGRSGSARTSTTA